MRTGLRKASRALLLATCSLVSLFGVHDTRADNRERDISVMTYNMYLGTDLGEIFAVQSQQELVAEVAEAFGEVQAGNPSTRIARIADQMLAAGPDLVCLQEVALWRTGPFNPDAPATTVAFDFLQLLLDELEQRGLHYAPIAVLNNFEAEAPAVGSAGLFDVRFTDRLAVLARTDLQTSRLKLESVEARHFATNLPFSHPLLGDLTILRGWIGANIKTRGKTYRLVNAHLESFSPLVNIVQAHELLNAAGGSELPVLLAGDFNSDAEAGEPSYQLFVGAGFIDAWRAINPNEPGYTWPLFVLSAFTYTAPTQRLDLIMSRGAIQALSADVVGDEDVTPASPMSSDHAGLVATLSLTP